MKLEDLEFSVRTMNVLDREGVKTLEALTDLSLIEVLRWRNVGKKTIREIRNKLKSVGKGFRDDYDRFCPSNEEILRVLSKRVEREKEHKYLYEGVIKLLYAEEARKEKRALTNERLKGKRNEAFFKSVRKKIDEMMKNATKVSMVADLGELSGMIRKHLLKEEALSDEGA